MLMLNMHKTKKNIETNIIVFRTLDQSNPVMIPATYPLHQYSLYTVLLKMQLFVKRKAEINEVLRIYEYSVDFYLFHNALDHNDIFTLPGYFTRDIICFSYAISILVSGPKLKTLLSQFLEGI